MDYTLSKNQLYKKEGDPLYVARARVSSRMTKNQVIAALAHATTLTEADINAVLSGLEGMLVQFIVLGHSIDLGFLGLGFSIKGGFDSKDDVFRKGRNWLSINPTIAASFVDAVNKGIKFDKVNADGPAPKLLEIVKVLGDRTTTDFKANNLIRIAGSKLAFDPKDVETGVFLQPETGNALRAIEYAKASDISILWRMPDGVTPGNNTLEVRKRKSDGSIIKGVLDAPIVIAA